MLGSIIGGALGAVGSLFGQSKEQKAQEKFAKNGIQWKVADAKEAGIHPLFALGANTVSYSPMGLGSTLGSLGSEMGQDIGRSVAAGMSREQKSASFENSLAKLALERGGLENEILRSQLRKINQPASPPPLAVVERAVPGQGDSGPAGRTIRATGVGDAVQLPAPDSRGARLRVAPVDPDAVPHTLMLPGGVEWQTLPRSPAQNIEDQYGDLPEFVYGVARVGEEAWHNLKIRGHVQSRKIPRRAYDWIPSIRFEQSSGW